jgi:hypothetical protein
MAIEWSAHTSTMWIAFVPPYRVVVLQRDGRWVGRVEQGLNIYTSSVTYQTRESAQAWGEWKLATLLEHR